jgi:hypothetical protein
MAPKPQQFLVDTEGNRVGVVLDIREYQAVLEDLEELESVRAFDAAKASGETPVPFEEAVAVIEKHRR